MRLPVVALLTWAGIVSGGCATQITPDASAANRDVSDGKAATPDDIVGMVGRSGSVLLVSGRCRGATIPMGPPPVTRSDWPIFGDSAAVYVFGPRPAGCDRDSGDTSISVSFLAELATDSVMSSQSWQRRVYLIRRQ